MKLRLAQLVPVLRQRQHQAICQITYYQKCVPPLDRQEGRQILREVLHHEVLRTGVPRWLRSGSVYCEIAAGMKFDNFQLAVGLILAGPHVWIIRPQHEPTVYFDL